MASAVGLLKKESALEKDAQFIQSEPIREQIALSSRC